MMRWDAVKNAAHRAVNLCSIAGDGVGEVRAEQVITWTAVTAQQNLSKVYSVTEEIINITFYSGERKISFFVPGDQFAVLEPLIRQMLPEEGAAPHWIENVERGGCSLHIDGEYSLKDSLNMVESIGPHPGYWIGESARCGMVQKAYLNTLGAESECSLPFSEYNAYVRGGKIDFYYSGHVHRPPDKAEDMVNQVGDYVNTLCKTLPNAEQATPQKCPVVMDAVPFSVIMHEVFGHLLEYDLAVKNCFTADDRGTPIAPECVTIRDTPCVQDYFFVPFDDEGTVGREALLVEKGVLREFLTDRKAAHILKQAPKGSSRAQDATFSPMIRSRTTVLEEGTHTFEELLEEAEGGLYLYGVYKVDAQPDGSFSLSIPLGYTIAHGELGNPVFGIRISGNLFDFLNKMSALGKESRFQISHCSKSTGANVQNVKVGVVCPAAAFTEWNVESEI